MSVGLKQSLNMSQSLVMTPQLQQAIKLLQLSRMELENLINSELVENPILEETPETEGLSQQIAEPAAPEGAKADDNPQASGDEFNWDSYIDNFKSTPNLPAYKGGEDDLPSYENTVSQPASLTEHLVWQLKLSAMPENQKTMGEIIIGNLNEDGYLQATIEELAQKENFDPHELEAVLYCVQQFDPIGVASRNLQECLSVQIADLYPEDEYLEAMVENHITDLEKKNYHVIAKALGLSLDHVVERVKLIEELEPKPGRGFGGSPSHYIIPDIYVVKRGAEYVVMLNEDGLPKLKISAFYKNLLDKDKSADATKEYVQGKLKSAVWLIKSIHQRQRTIFKVTESIVKQQYDFFEKGIAFLKPMVLRDVANDIGMHESTISRVTTNKYVHTPRGIFELKFFFNSGISRVSGSDVASETVKEKVRAIVGAEPEGQPFSDQKIVEILMKDNINIARRTVAKYREMLGILPSSKRKKGY